MNNPSHCPECGTRWENGVTCQDHFHQMLYWENENPGLGEVHHLMVLSYYLQHPSLYSREMLRGACQMLVDFLDQDVTPQEMRRRMKASMDSGQRPFRIKGTQASHGAYDHPLTWTMTAADVVSGGMDPYRENIRSWARSILESLRRSRNLPSPFVD